MSSKLDKGWDNSQQWLVTELSHLTYSLFIYQDEHEDENENQSFCLFFLFWNKPVTNEPIILCNVILRAWFVCHRHYLERTKTFVYVLVMAHEQAIRILIGLWTTVHDIHINCVVIARFSNATTDSTVPWISNVRSPLQIGQKKLGQQFFSLRSDDFSCQELYLTSLNDLGPFVVNTKLDCILKFAKKSGKRYLVSNLCSIVNKKKLVLINFPRKRQQRVKNVDFVNLIDN